MSKASTDLLERPSVAPPPRPAPDADAIALRVSAHLRVRGATAPGGGAVGALELIEASIRDLAAHDSVANSVAECAQAVALNGCARYDTARVTAERASARADVGHVAWALNELVEASVRSGRRGAATRALHRLEERTRTDDADWALGILARSRALLAGGEDAEVLYKAAIARFADCGLVVHLARAELIYGEWLRRENRRVDAREQLRTAHGRFVEIGLQGFAERARRELAATCETVRRRSLETRDDLTAQETEIAQLAATGHTNSEIARLLFLSPRTIEWHLRKVFAKLGVSSRRALRTAVAPEWAASNA